MHVAKHIAKTNENYTYSIMLQGKSGRQRDLDDTNSSSKRMPDFGTENGPKWGPFRDILEPKLGQNLEQKMEPKKDSSKKL